MIPATTLVHAADSEARPEKTHASFKVVLPNLRHGCALWRKIAMQKADAAPMGQKKHHRRLHDGSEKNTIIPETTLVATKVHVATNYIDLRIT